MALEDLAVLTPEKAAIRDKMVHWYEVSAGLVFNKHTCVQGWKDFTSSTAEGCADYHAVFSLLDLMGMVSSPWAHEDFYKGALWTASHDRQGARVLISGLATPSMADIVLEATNPEAKIDVLDVCPTPLLTCQKVFKPEQVERMKFIQRDALVFDGEGVQYDAITTDAFLTRFPEEGRLKVLRKWVKMLKPDGRAVTTWRIGGKQGQKGYGDADDQRIFMENLEKRVRDWGIPMSTFSEMQTIFGLAKAYAEKMHSYSGQTVEQIKTFMKQCFGDVRIEESGWVYDVVLRKYARIIAYDPIKD
ncbi:hypothetical protein CO018_03005 [Candidatus Beckwithbacteria bacterium CG_4_9_14_0_2_um_filter_47_11]|uniref:Methyltransferase domain-containing protein n=1 Tax=Candidatus Beckwithbacteria bacterium CG_4_9_14_0_2_um_filter_47_11 TaxID=1974494 RepID=A0A2M8G3K4_9BACT|nr:MAG: hypothetical protein CO018_03005 [Candidatus Beckwithbacteria bacterium CG_4_9_14_0_2_um_filter_47_11]